MNVKELKEKSAKIGAFLEFLSETSKIGEFMKDHPWNEANNETVEAAQPPYPRRAIVARRLRDTKRKAKLLSGTGKTSAMVTPDGVSIVFQSISQGYTIHWPVSDWPELKKWLDSRFEKAI